MDAYGFKNGVKFTDPDTCGEGLTLKKGNCPISPSAWFHFVFAQITQIEDDQEWFCQACLLDFVDRELDTTSLVDP